MPSPWNKVSPMKLREEFVLLALEPRACMAKLCRQYGISRQNGYKWVNRYREEGVDGLQDQSRRPLGSRVQASGEVVLQVLELRFEHVVERRAEQAAEGRLTLGEAADPEVDVVDTAGRGRLDVDRARYFLQRLPPAGERIADLRDHREVLDVVVRRQEARVCRREVPETEEGPLDVGRRPPRERGQQISRVAADASHARHRLQMARVERYSHRS